MTDGKDRPDEVAERARRLAEIFGEALPDQTQDERSDDWADKAPSRGKVDEDDERLRREVPPHHG